LVISRAITANSKETNRVSFAGARESLRKYGVPQLRHQATPPGSQKSPFVERFFQTGKPGLDASALSSWLETGSYRPPH
jgi:hypothetical protein